MQCCAAVSACLLIVGCRLTDGTHLSELSRRPISSRPSDTDSSRIRAKQPPGRFGDDSDDSRHDAAGENALVQITGIETAAARGAASSDAESGSPPTEATDKEQSYGFRDDVSRFWPRLRDDTRGLVNWNNAILLGGALGGALALRSDVDGDVRRDTARHPARWSDGTKVLEKFGDPTYQLPVLAGLYAYSLKQRDPQLHDLSGSLLSAYTISSVGTVIIKGIANTDRPSGRFNNGHFGFPSFHTSSAFSLAAVLDEYYGPRAGLPAYALAGLVGWSRIDQRDHDLSDVVFGAAIGFVVGKAVAGRRLHGDSRVRLRPYTHPTESANGVMLDIAY